MHFFFFQVLQELPALLSEADLHIAQLSLNLLTSIAKLIPNALVNITDHILPEILTLVKSPLLQGAALTSMLELFQALVLANLPGLGYRELLSLLVNPVSTQGAIGPSGIPMPALHKQVNIQLRYIYQVCKIFTNIYQVCILANYHYNVIFILGVSFFGEMCGCVDCSI